MGKQESPQRPVSSKSLGKLVFMALPTLACKLEGYIDFAARREQRASLLIEANHYPNPQHAVHVRANVIF